MSTTTWIERKQECRQTGNLGSGEGCAVDTPISPAVLRCIDPISWCCNGDPVTVEKLAKASDVSFVADTARTLVKAAG
jgi:hypothetical protein